MSHRLLQIPVQLHELQIFTSCLILRILHFLVKHSGAHRGQTRHQQMFVQGRVNGTSAYAHSVSCTLTQRFCSTAFTTVFFADSFRRTSWPGLIFNASASTKLSCPTPDHGIWWHIFTINNNHSVVYLLWLNVLQCQKFCNCIITDFSEISHNVQPAFFQYIKSHKVKKQMTWNF